MNRAVPAACVLLAVVTLPGPLSALASVHTVAHAARTSHHARGAGAAPSRHATPACTKTAPAHRPRTRARGSPRACGLSPTALRRWPTSQLPHFPVHAVGDIFGVGSFVSQRSWTIAPLVVGRERELGTRWVREEFTASQLHAGTAGRYDWKEYDRAVNEELHAGIRVLGLLDYSNTWGFHDHGTMPHAAMKQLIADYARFVRDVVGHFRGRVSYWEMWNEPDLDTFWHPAPDAGDYARLLTAAARAAKSRDRHARVVLAGTSGVDLPFIRAVAAHTRSFDIIAVHPYRSLPEPRFFEQVRALEQLHRPIWFSEVGWPAGDGCERCFGEVEQARYLVRFYTLAAAAGIQHVFWYDLRDDPHTASDPEAHYGLLRRDLSGKPAFTAYAYLSRLLDGSRYLGADHLGEHALYTLRFQQGDSHLAVLWNAGDITHHLALRWPYPRAYFITIGGDVLAELTPSDERISVIAPEGGEPFYVSDRLPAYRVPDLGALLHRPSPPPPPRRPAVRAPRPSATPAHAGARAEAGMDHPGATPTPTVTTKASEHTVAATHARAHPAPDATPAPHH